MRSTIKKAIFMETGTYNDLSMRPYNTNVDMGSLRMFQEATLGGTSISAAAISGIAGNVLKPAAQSNGVINIANGWDVPRLRFMMEIEHVGSVVNKQIQYVTGYTDYVGVSQHGVNTNIDPNMRLFLNNVVTTRNVVENVGWGPMERNYVSNASHILMGEHAPSFGNFHNVTHSMRPEDVFATASLNFLANGDTIDTRTTFQNGQLKKSNRTNSSASNYLSRVLQAHINTHKDNDFSDDYSIIMDNARGSDIIQDPLVSADSFLYKLTSETSLANGGTTLYGELCRLHPELDSISLFILKDNKTTVHQRGSTEHWNGNTLETVTATILSHSVPSIMMDLMLTGVNFMATNQTITGEYVIQLLGSKSFSNNVDLTPYLENFLNRLKSEVLRGITNNNTITFNLTMHVDLLGETFISISVNGQPSIDYVMPSFCDALSTPVLTNNRQDLLSLTHDVTTLADNIQVNINNEIGALNGNSFSL